MRHHLPTLLLAVALLVAGMAPPNQALAAPPPNGPPLHDGLPAPVLSGELVMRTYSVDMYRLPGTLSAKTIQNLGMPVEQAISDGIGMIGSGLIGRVAIRFEPPQSGPCALRGITSSPQRTIRLFYAPNSDPNRVLAILAHELFHQLQHDYYGTPAQRRVDNILLEGMAVWGTGAYFRDPSGEPLYRVRVRQALHDGTLLPLTTSLEADCRTATRNTIYDQWASFVEYLLVTYGREKFDAAYRDSTGRSAGSANYCAAYGKLLAQLEAEWLAWLRANDKH